MKVQASKWLELQYEKENEKAKEIPIIPLERLSSGLHSVPDFPADSLVVEETRTSSDSITPLPDTADSQST